MNQFLACIALVVRDYDEAIARYRNTLAATSSNPGPPTPKRASEPPHFRTRRPHPDTPGTRSARQSQGNRHIPLRVSGL